MIKRLVKRWLFVALIMVGALVIWLNTDVIFFLQVFLFLAVTAIVSFLWAFIVARTSSIEIIRRAPSEVSKGEALVVEAIVVNHGGIPLVNIVMEDNLSCAADSQQRVQFLCSFVPAKGRVTLHYRAVCPKRGRYTLGPMVLYFFDPLGLFFSRRFIAVYSEVFVYPRTFPVRNFPALAKGIVPWFGLEVTQAAGEEDEFFGLREYRHGDPIKRIHWMTSARKQTLVVKQYQQQLFSRATLLFALSRDTDYGQADERVSEYMITVAASLAKYLLDQDISLEVIAHTGELIQLHSNKGLEHLEDIFRFLAEAQAGSTISLGELMHEFAAGIPHNSTVIALMTEKDWEHVPVFLPLTKRDVLLIPVVFLSSTFVYADGKKDVHLDVKAKISQRFSSAPLVIGRGDKLEEVFAK